MKTLTLSLKKQWFDMIKAGVKKEEYRELKDYWFNRFYHSMNPDGTSCKYNRLVFTLGYPKAGDTERRLTFKTRKSASARVAMNGTRSRERRTL